MLWLKAFHIAAMVAWFSGLFYLPRLFVYHAMSDDEISNERFKIMERKLYRGIATPAAVVTIVLGFLLLYQYAWAAYKTSLWLHLKLGLVVILIGYHHMCGFYLKQFAKDNNKKSHVYFRWFNEFPVLLLFAIVILAVVKPF